MPAIRALMRQFGVSQVVVQRAFQGLRDRGLIESEVGRGTFFRGEAGEAVELSGVASRPSSAPANKVRSVLLLRRSVSIARGRVLVEGLQRRFAADGHRVLEVSYTDPVHAQAVLKGLPHFDACVVQSSFRTITTELLAALRTKTNVIAIDGAALSGADVDAVGMEWGEPLAEAVDLLRARGHRRVAYACTTRPFLATQLGHRRLEYLQRHRADMSLQTIAVAQFPDEDYQEALVAAVKAAAEPSGRLPFSGLVAWGIEDGARFRRLLADAGIDVPAALSVVLLGRTDLPNEHAGFFDAIGCQVADQIESLYEAVVTRWADPSAPHGVRLIPVTSKAGQSVRTV